MPKSKKEHDDLLPGDDLDAFDEFERDAGQEGIEENEPADAEDDDFDFAEFEEEAAPSNEPLDPVGASDEPGAIPKTRRSGVPSEPPPSDPSGRADEADTAAAAFSDLAPDVPINLVAVIGRTRSNVGELIEYRPGQVIDLGRTPGETVDLVANGRLIARGELVEMDGKLGVRILKFVK